ncbi:MAG: NUDIX domain-containing protein [Saprospiraceae bacterium]|nr:NUDIX domain-containing protein [Saprospiraceae bacterium]
MPSIRPTALCLFEYRGRLLLQEFRNFVTGEVFYRPFGGGLEFGERAASAIRREILEELGAEISSPELLTIMEDIHDMGEGTRHNIVFLFRAELLDENLLEAPEFRVIDNQIEFRAVWQPIGALHQGELLLHPPELRMRLPEFFPEIC